MNISLTIAGILCVSILGTLLHFTYRWSGRNPLIGLIAPVNESVWEHMKLLFFPMLLFGLWNLKGVTEDVYKRQGQTWDFLPGNALSATRRHLCAAAPGPIP